MPTTLRIGTRGSRLALAQTEQVAALIREMHPNIVIDTVIVTTPGDIDRRSALANIGGSGVFTKTIETELLSGRIDLAVHSAKDLPSVMTPGLCIAAVPPRAACEDVWIARSGLPLDRTPQGAMVGTSAPRRRALLLHRRPDLRVQEIRGNIETRLRKLQDGEYDAVVMARAGLLRLGLDTGTAEMLSPDWFIPAPGQGALVVQARADDDMRFAATAGLDHPDSRRCLEVERLLLQELGAGCSAAVGGWARLEHGVLRLSATVLDKAGATRLLASGESVCREGDAAMTAAVVADLLAQGAAALIEKTS